MSEWKEYKFSDIARFVSDKIDISLISEEEYISTDNMLPNFGGVCFAEKLPQSPRCNSFLENDILFSNIRTYFKKIWLATFDGGCSADVLVIRSKNQHIVLQQYLYLLICSPDFINFTITSSNGAKMPRGDKKAILNYTFLIPPINYQKLAINHYLLFNNKIHLNTQTNQTLEAIAQAIFKHWFIDFAPVHAKAQALIEGKTAEQAELAAMASISGKTEQQVVELAQTNPQAYQQLQQTAAAFPSEFEKSELGLVPKGWECKLLKDVCKIIYGKNLPTSKLENTGFPVFGGNGVIGYFHQYLYEQPQVLISCRGAASGKVMYSLPKSYVTNNSLIVESTENMSYFFIYENLLRKDLKDLVSGSAQPQLTIANLNTVNILVPTRPILQIYTENVSCLYDCIYKNNQQNEILVQTRDTLLPKLLNGEIYV